MRWGDRVPKSKVKIFFLFLGWGWRVVGGGGLE